MQSNQERWPVPGEKELSTFINKLGTRERPALAKAIKTGLERENIEPEEKEWAGRWLKILDRFIILVNYQTSAGWPRQKWGIVANFIIDGHIFLEPGAFRTLDRGLNIIEERAEEINEMLFRPECPVAVLKEMWLEEARGWRINGRKWPKLYTILEEPAVLQKAMTDEALGAEILQQMDRKERLQWISAAPIKAWIALINNYQKEEEYAEMIEILKMARVSSRILTELKPEMLKPWLLCENQQVRLEVIKTMSLIGKTAVEVRQGRKLVKKAGSR